MKITTEYHSTPAQWCAITDEYDGAEDAGPQLVGWGKTEREAIEDLVEHIRDDAYAQGQRDGQDQVHAEKEVLRNELELRIARLQDDVAAYREDIKEMRGCA